MRFEQFMLMIFFVFTMSGCSLLMSGQEPIPLNAKSRDIITDTSTSINVPKLFEKKDGLNFYIIVFDGTNNDCTVIKNDCSIAGRVFHELKKYYQTKYYAGPKYLNAIICFTCKNTSEEAIEYLDSQIIKDNPSEARVIVIGFSRGAAIARNFMNLVDKKFHSDLSKLPEPDRPLVRTVGLLYDTVDTTIVGDMDLRISKSTDFFVHFISSGEQRIFFPVTKDELPQFPSIENGNITKTIRSIEINLPGSHSDTGGAYEHGAGLYYNAITWDILHKFGLLKIDSLQIPKYSLSSGVYDSRGVIDKLSGHSQRGVEYVEAHKLSESEISTLERRIRSMLIDKIASTHSITNDAQILSFFVLKEGGCFSIVEYEGFINNVSSKCVGDRRTIHYRINTYQSLEEVDINDEAWNVIQYGMKSRIDLTSIRNKDGQLESRTCVNDVCISVR
jgi:hypothetical protein